MQEPVRKGKSNAILTYELMATFDNKLTAIMTKFDYLLGTLAERKEVQDAHAAAIRFLEQRLTVLETRTDTSKKMINETLAVILSVISLIISGIGGATFIIWHPR